MSNCSDVIKVLEIVGKYKDLDNEWLEAQHDILYFPLMEDDEISDKDRKQLEDLDCHINEGYWSLFT